MFYCSFCKKLSKPNDTSTKVVVESRDKVYLEPTNPMRSAKRTKFSFRETVKEVVSCSPCLSNTKFVEKVGNTYIRTGLI